MYLDDISEELDISLDSDNSETIGGLLIDILGEIPDSDDLGVTVDIDNLRFRIDSVRDRRIEQITLTVLDEDELERGKENEQSEQ